MNSLFNFYFLILWWLLVLTDRSKTLKMELAAILFSFFFFSGLFFAECRVCYLIIRPRWQTQSTCKHICWWFLGGYQGNLPVRKINRWGFQPFWCILVHNAIGFCEDLWILWERMDLKMLNNFGRPQSLEILANKTWISLTSEDLNQGISSHLRIKHPPKCNWYDGQDLKFILHLLETPVWLYPI